MPKKGKKGGKKKGGKKKGSSKAKTSASADKGPKTTGYLLEKEKRPLYIPLPGENLLHVLTTHKVEEKELHNMTVSVRALKELSPQEIRDLRLMFETFDSNADGLLDPDEVQSALCALGFEIQLVDVYQMVADVNPSQMTVDFNYFMDFVIDKQGLDWDLHDEITQAFKHFDIEEKEKISLSNLKELCRRVNLKLTEQEMIEMIEEADFDGDNCVNLEEFVSVMSKTNIFQK